MQIISIKATNMDMTAAIEAYVKDKLESIEKLMIDFRPEPTVTVEVGKSTTHHNKGPYFLAEFNLTVPGDVLRARTEAEDLYEAIDVAKDDLRRQVAEFKDRLVEAKREPRPDKV
jgi:ribosomal subunit interface protein